MVLTYEPRVLKVRVTPGNVGTAMLEIKSSHGGSCWFNTHVASCGTAVPEGTQCVTRHLDDTRPEYSGALLLKFNTER